MNIVIPMAGSGSRFSGSPVPKPFIEFNGKMMIEHVLSAFEGNPQFVLVIQKKFKTEQYSQLGKLARNYDIKFVTVPRLTMGAAVTCLAAHRVLDKNSPVLFADSDNIFSKNALSGFLDDAKMRNLDASLLTFKSDLPMYSYALVDEKGLLVKMAEKQVISEHAICGAYYFKNVDDFISAAIDLVVANDIQKGEFYMSNVYNFMLKYKNNIGIYEIAQGGFDCVGTPEQLNKYKERSKHDKNE